LYLLFCWTGIPMILSVVDGVLYLMCKTDEEFTIKYVL
jgi:TM2 domain-containing membrane protein YozV